MYFPPLEKSFLALAILAAAAALPARAESSASSAVSDSVSTSVGSSSTSVQKSSNSSSKDDKVAAGDYRIVDVTEAADQPGKLRLRLQALADAGAEGEFFLYLPRETQARQQLDPGQIVAVRQRPYGLEFARAETRQAFFLALTDDWYRELQTQVVEL
jgi:hypothetical protein